MESTDQLRSWAKTWGVALGIVAALVIIIL